MTASNISILSLGMARRIAPLLCMMGLLSTTISSFSQAPEPAQSGDPLVRVQATNANAKQLAAYGKIDASLAAMRALLKNGPPQRVSLTTIFQTLSGQGLSVASVQHNQLVTRTVGAGLLELDELWRSRQAPPEDVYTTLRSIMLPEVRASEMFPYFVKNASWLIVPRSAACVLVDWAVDAGQVEDLRDFIVKRYPKSPGRDARLLITRFGSPARSH